MEMPDVEVLTNTERMVLTEIANRNGLATFGIIRDAIGKSEDSIFKAIGKLICFKIITSEIIDGKASFCIA